MLVQSGRLKACFPFSIAPRMGPKDPSFVSSFSSQGRLASERLFKGEGKVLGSVRQQWSEKKKLLAWAELLTATSSLPGRMADGKCKVVSTTKCICWKVYFLLVTYPYEIANHVRSSVSDEVWDLLNAKDSCKE
ncbi:hypothetical protein [Brevibacillus sp. SAFN-007a]|uniref:hypothetical protein n=1 Tax=Brevibacillus sp. SAFN-007a TaxID=3436862 RepID=UPI003F7F10E4